MSNQDSKTDRVPSLRRRTGRIALFRLPPRAEVPAADPDAPGPLEAVVRTPEETSVVRAWGDRAMSTVRDATCAGPFLAWSVPGTLDFELVGILARIVEPLRDAGVPVLAVSTFDTDWILVDEKRGSAAEAAWRSAGIEILEGDPLDASVPDGASGDR